jgi:UDP-glucose 4-epimerase
MEGTRRRILITGVARFLGLRLAKLLENDDEVETVIGVDLEEPPIPVRNLEFVRADVRSPLIARVLEASRVDTVVHTNISSSPRLFGGRPQMKENNVIGTMQLLAAAQRAERVKSVVVKSSAAVYGWGESEPSLVAEEDVASPGSVSGYGKDCADAETEARDFGRRRPDVSVTILRMASVIGPTVTTSMTGYLSLPVLPSALGYDPRLQFLHEEDAVAALRLASLKDAKGIFNIGGSGVVYLSKAARMLGRLEVPLVGPIGQATAVLLRALGLVDFPLDQLKLLVRGRVLDITRARDILDFRPRFTTEEALIDFRDNRAGDHFVEQTAHPGWEREVFEYLRRKAADREPAQR